MRPLPLLAALVVAILIPAARAGDSSTVQAIADAYGIQAWPSVQRVTFTFNAQLPNKTVTRHWVWEPQTNQVTLTDAEDKTTTYQRAGTPTDETLAAIDQQFINDSYWLLFPFHLVWDSGTTITEKAGPLPLPVGEGEAAKSLTIQYATEGGYTPGDAYDLYLDEKNEVQAWTFRKGGSDEVTMATTWSKPEKFGPIRIATDHRGTDDVRIFFTEVAVESN